MMAMTSACSVRQVERSVLLVAGECGGEWSRERCCHHELHEGGNSLDPSRPPRLRKLSELALARRPELKFLHYLAASLLFPSHHPHRGFSLHRQISQRETSLQPTPSASVPPPRPSRRLSGLPKALRSQGAVAFCPRHHRSPTTVALTLFPAPELPTHAR